MDRVTEEWLLEAESNSYYLANEQHPNAEDYQAWEYTRRLAFARAMARECVRLIGVGAGTKNATDQIRARFGLEDEARVQQAREVE